MPCPGFQRLPGAWCPLVQAQLNTILFDRYCVLPAIPLAATATAQVKRCVDLNDPGDTAPVVVKAMKNAAGWWREVQIRHSLGQDADASVPVCVPLRRCAVLGAAATLPPPADGAADPLVALESLVDFLSPDQPLSSASDRAQQIMAELPFAIVMPAAECTLRSACDRGDFRGNRMKEVAEVVGQLVAILAALHDIGTLHLRFTPDAVVRLDGRWLFAGLSSSADLDLDGDIPLAIPFDECEAFLPPELMLWRTQHPESDGSTPPPPVVKLADFPDAFGLVSSEQIDLWGLGLAVFSMCAGYDLFDNDAGKLTTKGREKMLAWAGLGAADGAAISAAFGADDPDVASAVALIEWLLHPSVSSRPITTSEVSAHAFVSGAGAELELRKENEQAALLAKKKAETKVEALARSTRKILAQKKKLEKVASSVQQESEELQEQQGWDWEEIASLKAELAQLRGELEVARASAVRAADPTPTPSDAVGSAAVYAQVAILEADLKGKDNEIAQARKMLEAKDGELAQTQKALEAKDGELAQVRKALEGKDGELAQARKALEALQSRLHPALDEAQAMRNECAKVTSLERERDGLVRERPSSSSPLCPVIACPALKELFLVLLLGAPHVF